jgi:hypothetical protein
MGYIHCCGGLHKTRSFVLVPAKNFVVCELDYLKKCPRCENLVIQVTKIDRENNVTTIRYTKQKALDFWNKIQPKILYEKKYYQYLKYKGGKFYLNYNEFGIKKRCYSNIKNLKIGLNSNF